MTTIEQQNKAQIEQNPTLKNKVENFQEEQELVEAVLNSQEEQEKLTTEQKTQEETVTLAQKTLTENEEKEINALTEDIKTENKTLTEKVKNETKTLEDKIKTQEPTPQSLSDKEIEKIKDNATLKKVANERINKCNKLLDGLKGNRKSKAELKDNVKRAIDDMTKMTQDEHIYETGLNHYKNRLGKIIYDYYSNREPSRQIIMMGERVPVINGTADTKREAKRDKRRAKNNAEYQIDMSEIKQNTAIYRLIGANANEWGDYCDFIGQGGIAIGHPVYIQYEAGFKQIREYDPNLYRAITPSGHISYETYCQRNPGVSGTNRQNNMVCRPKSFNRRFGERFSNTLEHIRPNWMNNDPRKKEARTNIGSVVAIGGAIFMGIKAITSLKKGKDGKRNRLGAAGWAAGTLALLNNDLVFNTLQDAFNIHPAERTKEVNEMFKKYRFSDEQAREMTDRYIGAPITTMSALHFIPIYELEKQNILEWKDENFEFNYTNYETYINKLNRNNKQKEEILKAGQKLRDDKCIGAGLKAFGITTWEKLKSLFGSDKKKTLADTDEVKNGRKGMVEKVSCGVNAELYKHGLRIKNIDDVDKIMEEYEEKKDKVDKNKMILEWMKAGLLEFNKDKDYTMEEMLKRSDIDLENMTMKGFKSGRNEVKFNSYSDLFETVYVTNDIIKYKFAGMQAKSEKPFKVNSLGQLKFDDTDWYEIFSSDTMVISRKSFINDLPTLKDNKDFYANYLNDWRELDTIEHNKIDLSGYPILKNVGIDFIDENEAKKLETVLEKIKHELRFYKPTKFGDPFEIKDGVLKIKIEFTTIGESKKSWDISGLKTLSKESNQRKLLDYMNKESNQMWGSYL